MNPEKYILAFDQGTTSFRSIVFNKKGEIADHWETDRVYAPERSVGEMQALREGWERAIDRAKAWKQPGG